MQLSRVDKEARAFDGEDEAFRPLETRHLSRGCRYTRKGGLEWKRQTKRGEGKEGSPSQLHIRSEDISLPTKVEKEVDSKNVTTLTK